jgi:hypothetical protein
VKLYILLLVVTSSLAAGEFPAIEVGYELASKHTPLLQNPTFEGSPSLHVFETEAPIFYAPELRLDSENGSTPLTEDIQHLTSVTHNLRCAESFHSQLLAKEQESQIYESVALMEIPSITLSEMPPLQGGCPLEPLNLPGLTTTASFEGADLDPYHEWTTNWSKRSNRRHRSTGYELALFPTLDELKTDTLTDEFLIDLKVQPKKGEGSYHFTLTLTPKEPSSFKPLPHHVYFLLDQSNTIDQNRFEAFRNGIRQTIRYLNENASFNVILFDNEIQKIHGKDLKPTRGAENFARKSLSKAKQKKISSNASLLSILEDIKRKAKDSDHIYTVILLSNGQLMKNIRYDRESLLELIYDPLDNFTIFTATSSDKNNLGMLSLLAKLGRGELLHAKSDSAFPRKLSHLVTKIRSPIANNIAVTPVANQMVEIHHANTLAPLLYAERPYQIIGTTSTLDDIDLIIQGEMGERYMNIPIKISLKDAKQTTAPIEKEIALEVALEHMVHFLYSNDPDDLLMAGDLLSPFRAPTPFK